MTSRIVAVGGGQVTEEITSFCLELCSGKNTSVFICALASAQANREKELAQELFIARHGVAPESVYLPSGLSGFDYEQFTCQETGPALVEETRKRLNSKSIIEAIWKAELLFLSGGDQRLLLKLLPETLFLEVVQKRWAAGELLVVGTSAGQQVMSDWALTGNSKAEEIVGANNTESVRGFGFLQNVVFDQHFIKRKRFARLFSALLDHPGCLGVGVDENTALFVEGLPGRPASRVEVIGDSAAVVFQQVAAAERMQFVVDFFFAGERFSYPLMLGLGCAFN